MLSSIGIYAWAFRIPGFRLHHELLLGIYLGIYPACWCAVLGLWRRQSSGVFLLLAPSSWVALEFVKNHAGFLAFPWAGLAESQHACLPLLQLASIGGAASVSFILVLFNTALAESLRDHRRLRPLLTVLPLVLLILAWGSWRLRTTSKSSPRLRVAVIQPAISLD
ncbi:MAG: hypothetical protein GXO34_06075, partial [Deltaproteobacteria bacterium]|nr:hypothetical protein [Deltaproteobacteria bacterium]